MNDFLTGYLANLIPVPFGLEQNGKIQTIGNGTPLFTVTLHKPLEKKELLQSTSLALAEAYIRGDLTVDKELYFVLDHFLGEMAKFTTDHHALKHILHPSSSKRHQKEEVSSHYDIGNDFYRLWLDPTLSYSCAYFKNDTDSLEQAQHQKVDHILQKLQLKEDMTLLDIGCGWGFLLLEAAKKYHIKGVGITLSKEQAKEFQRRIEENGLTDRLSVQLMDYRDLPKSGLTFDRVVSVGMLEHVGRDHYDLFLSCVYGVLKEGGLFLLHYISALQEHPGDAFIKKYIFPGGCIPSLREIIHLMGDHRFYTLDVESLRRHYNKTLLCWLANFRACRDKVVDMHGEEFARMWELYLASCAATFHNGIIDLHQILMSKGVNNDLPMTRTV